MRAQEFIEIGHFGDFQPYEIDKIPESMFISISEITNMISDFLQLFKNNTHEFFHCPFCLCPVSLDIPFPQKPGPK